MLRDELSRVNQIVTETLDEWKETARRMSLDNQPLNPNDDFFNRLERNLKDRLTSSCVIER